MKTNELIRLGNKREKPEHPLYYGKHKSQEFIVYENAAFFLVKKGTTKLLRETTSDRKRIKKLSEPSKAFVSLLETDIEKEDIVLAKITDTIRKTRGGAEVVLIKADDEERWVDTRFLSYFSPKRKAYFDMSGWKNNIVYITETGVFVGVICTVKTESVILE